jgi:GMP synthase PP-ATPase subunit
MNKLIIIISTVGVQGDGRSYAHLVGITAKQQAAEGGMALTAVQVFE